MDLKEYIFGRAIYYPSVIVKIWELWWGEGGGWNPPPAPEDKKKPGLGRINVGYITSRNVDKISGKFFYCYSQVNKC